MPEWAVTVIVTAIIAPIITAIIAPIVVARLQRGRNVADENRVHAEADKVRAETRLLEIQELEAKVKHLIDAATYGTAELIEQQRGEIIELRNRVREQDLQISIMSETLNTLSAGIRRLESERDELKAQLESVNDANIELIKRLDELESEI